MSSDQVLNPGEVSSLNRSVSGGLGSSRAIKRMGFIGGKGKNTSISDAMLSGARYNGNKSSEFKNKFGHTHSFTEAHIDYGSEIEVNFMKKGVVNEDNGAPAPNAYKIEANYEISNIAIKDIPPAGSPIVATTPAVPGPGLGPGLGPSLGPGFGPQSTLRYKVSDKTVFRVAQRLLLVASELHTAFKKFSIVTNYEFAAKDDILSQLKLVKLDIIAGYDTLGKCRSQDTIRQLNKVIAQLQKILGAIGGNLAQMTEKSDPCFIRALYLSMFGCFNELSNASEFLKPEVSEFWDTLQATVSTGDKVVKLLKKFSDAQLQSACIRVKECINKILNSLESNDKSALNSALNQFISEIIGLLSLSKERMANCEEFGGVKLEMLSLSKNAKYLITHLKL